MSSEYDRLDRYLKTVFSLMEGLATVEEAQVCLREYLEWHRQSGLQSEPESFLIELFFDKCRKEFSDV